MGDLHRSAATDHEVRVHIEHWLAHDIELDELETPVGAVLLFFTERIKPDGSVARRRGRAYPLGDLNSADEFWLVERAARDGRDADD